MATADYLTVFIEHDFEDVARGQPWFRKMDASKRATEENQIIFVKRSHLPLLCFLNYLN